MKNPPHHAARAVGRMAPVLRIAIVFTVNHPLFFFEKCGEARKRTALTARGGGRPCRYIELVVWPEGVVSGPRSSAWPCPLVAAGSPRVDGGLAVGPAATLEVAYAVVIAALLVPPATGRPSHPPQRRAPTAPKRSKPKHPCAAPAAGVPRRRPSRSAVRRFWPRLNRCCLAAASGSTRSDDARRATGSCGAATASRCGAPTGPSPPRRIARARRAFSRRVD